MIFINLNYKITKMTENQLTQIIIGCTINIHRQLGPGLLESAYQECLAYELEDAGLSINREVPMPIVYKEVKLNHGYRIDILVENKIVIEIKSVESLKVVHLAQTLTYFRLGKFKLGLLLNFNTPVLKNGIRRVIN